MAEKDQPQEPQLVNNHDITPPPLPPQTNEFKKKLEPGTSMTILQSKDSRRILIDMGFSKHRA